MAILLCSVCPSHSSERSITIGTNKNLNFEGNIEPGVHCTKLRLKVPLKKTASGQERPVQVSANYSQLPSPAKQPQITEYFRNNGGGGGDQGQGGGGEQGQGLYLYLYFLLILFYFQII